MKSTSVRLQAYSTQNVNTQNVVSKNIDGYSYKMKSTSVRLQAYTSSGYNPNQISTLNQQQLAAKGYMQSPNDWKNVEITGYFKVNSYTLSTTNGAAHIELLSRGGTHSSSTPCEGTSYHSNLYQKGRSKFEKELEHTAGYTSNDPEKSGATSLLQGRGWIGIKAVFYTSPSDGTVKVEQWMDDTTDNLNSPGNDWRKLLEFSDDGNNWSAPENNCGGKMHNCVSIDEGLRDGKALKLVLYPREDKISITLIVVYSRITISIYTRFVYCIT